MRRLALSLALAWLVSTPAQAQSLQPGVAGNPVAEIPLQSLSVTRERPLFAPTRRPPAPPLVATPAPVVEAPPPQPTPSPLPSLLGTVIGPGGRMAVIATGDATPLRLHEGEMQGGWLLRSADPRSAVIEGYGKMLTLELPSTAAAAAGLAAPASPMARAKSDNAAEP